MDKKEQLIDNNDNRVFPNTLAENCYMPDGTPLTKEINYIKNNEPNSNLLINSDFRCPINQRGYVSGTSPLTNSFVLDRWSYDNGHTSSDNVTSANNYPMYINNGFITIGVKKDGFYNNFTQKIEFQRYFSKIKLTVSFKYRIRNGNAENFNCRIYSNITGSIGGPTEPRFNNFIADGDWHIGIWTMDYSQYDCSNATFIAINFNTISPKWYTGEGIPGLDSEQILDLEWVKLEEGDKATPLRTRLYDEELLLCMRYYQKYTGLDSVMMQHPSASNYIYDFYYTQSMRAIPKITITSYAGTVTSHKLLTNMAILKSTQTDFLRSIELNAEL